MKMNFAKLSIFSSFFRNRTNLQTQRTAMRVKKEMKKICAKIIPSLLKFWVGFMTEVNSIYTFKFK